MNPTAPQEKFYDLEIVYPVHLNPNVRKPVLKHLKDIQNVHIIEPLFCSVDE